MSQFPFLSSQLLGFALVLLAAACSEAPSASGDALPESPDASDAQEAGSADSTAEDAGPVQDTGEDAYADTEPEMDAGPDLPPDLGPDNGINPEFVLNEIELLPATEGFDLNGDGVPDNGLALLFADEIVGSALGGDPNEYIARSVRRGDLLLLLDFSRLDDFVQDDYLDIDIYLGRDRDDRRRNNFSGEEDFLVSCSSLTPGGTPESQFAAARIRAGQLTGDGGQFRFLISFSDTEVLLSGAMVTGLFSEEGDAMTQGMLGGAVSYEDLEEVVRNDPEIGPSFGDLMLSFLQSRLDIDLDQDGNADALSAAFRFTAVRATIDLDAPCAP